MKPLLIGLGFLIVLALLSLLVAKIIPVRKETLGERKRQFLG